MGVAIRDFIPEGEGPTGAEEARIRRGAIIRTGSNHQDFIPDPSDPTVKPHTSTSEERIQKAMDAAVARSAWASQHAFAEAQLRLKDMTPATAVQAIEVMPQAVMEMYVAAETLGAARQDILGMFPPVSPAVIERYRAELQGAAYEPEPEVSAPADIPAADPGDAEQAIQETFLCVDCDHEPFTTKAGLLSHGRAKH